MTHAKIFFEYDGSTPDKYEIESMWAVPCEGGYRIDNIPFYVRGIASADVVEVSKGPDGELWFKEVIRPSGHSTVRLLFSNVDDVQRVRDELRDIGCETEVSDLPILVAVDVPPEVPYSSVQLKLDQGEQTGTFEYEEGCIGHQS